MSRRVSESASQPLYYSLAADTLRGVSTTDQVAGNDEYFSEGSTGAPQPHRRGDDGLQEGARGDQGRHGEGRRVAPRERFGQGREALGPQGGRGSDRQLHPP